MNRPRATGVLMHISSLPGEYSVGSLGDEAYRFVDFLCDGGFSYWQTLPICMADECHSPYKSPAALSVNPLFIDLASLRDDGLLTDCELERERQSTPYLAENGDILTRFITEFERSKYEIFKNIASFVIYTSARLLQCG